MKLHSLYMGKNMCNKLMLKKRLYSLRMQEGRNVVDHIQKFDQMCNELLSIGIKLGEEDRSLLLLCLLPPSLNSLVTTLLYIKETLEYEDMVSVLRSNEKRRKLTKEGIPQKGLAMGERSDRGRGRSR